MNRPRPRYKTRHTAPRHHDYPFTPPCARRRRLARLYRFGEMMNDDWLSCSHCGSGLDWEDCGACEDGYSYHDCGEDCCCCLDPEPNVTCDQCEGNGGWWFCWNRQCPGKQDPAERVGTLGEPISER